MGSFLFMIIENAGSAQGLDLVDLPTLFFYQKEEI